MTIPDSDFVSIHTLTNRFEADLLADALQKEGIPAFVRTFEETPYNGLFVAQKGWGLLMVPEEEETKAKEIVNTIVDNLKDKSIFSDPSEIDAVLWEDLRMADPESVCRNALVHFDRDRNAYAFVFLNNPFHCFPAREVIEPAESNRCNHDEFNFHLAVLHYLLEAAPVGVKGGWISEKEIPGGELFFRGHHKLPVDPLKDLFGTRPELFQAVAARVGGIPMDMGDMAFQFRILPRIPLVLVLWQGDDEFDPELKVLFDETVHQHFRNLDTIWALIGAVSRCLHRIAKGLMEEESP